MKKIFVFILIIIAVSCGQKTQYRYYPSGEIAEKKEFFQKGDTSSYLLTEYYLNGQIKLQGNIINSVREGIWYKWFADGVQSWSVEYREGWRQPPDTMINLKYLFSDSLIAGKPIYMRISVEKIFIEDLTISFSNFSMYLSDNLDMYDFIVVPKQSGYIGITTQWAKHLGYGRMEKVIMRDSFYVYPSITD